LKIIHIFVKCSLLAAI